MKRINHQLVLNFDRDIWPTAKQQGLRYGQAFVNFFGIKKDAELFYETDISKAKDITYEKYITFD